MIPVVIVGAAGRMGQALRACLAEYPPLQLHAAVDRAPSADGGITTDLAAALRGARVMIDLSDADATAGNLTACAEAGVAAFVGTTGQGSEIESVLQRAARRVPVLLAANTSVGVTLLTELVRRVARTLPPQFDIEITEAHHRHKKDAPLGTALHLGRAAAQGRNREFDEVAVFTRHGIGLRAPGAIGFSVIRGGDIAGDHSVMFAGPGECLVLTHQVTDRTIFARGALRGATWLAEQRPGRYSMRDVLALDSTP